MSDFATSLQGNAPYRAKQAVAVFDVSVARVDQVRGLAACLMIINTICCVLSILSI